MSAHGRLYKRGREQHSWPPVSRPQSRATTIAQERMSFKSEPIFQGIEESLTSNPSLAKELVKKTNSVIVFNLKNKQGEQKSWTLDLKKDGSLTAGAPADADLTINIADLDFKRLVNGKSNSQKLFLTGKLKVKGDVMKAANIESVLKAVTPAKAKL